LHFKGVLLTDYHEINNLHEWHRVASSTAHATVKALHEGSVDVSMIPNNVAGFREGVKHGLDTKAYSERRIHESAKRVLQLKGRLDLFYQNMTMFDPNLNLVGTDEADVLHMVHQSIVLAKNENNFLPLDASRHLKIHVTGPTSHSRIYQSGGWTGQWQGAPDESWFTYGSTVRGAFQAVPAWDITYSCGTDILGDACGHGSIEKAVEAASFADVVVVCVGEESYTEKPGDIRSLRLPAGQYDLVRALSTRTNAKILLVYFGGRPRLLGDMVEQSDAVMLSFLPGPDAGPALVNLVSGRVNPSAKLPITYPLEDDGGGIPYFHAVSGVCTEGKGPLPHNSYVPCDVQWIFGHGLSYTTFEYTDFTAKGGIDKDLEISVMVKNTGSRAGAETVMFFTFDEFRPTTPEHKRLRVFEKVMLGVGEVATVSKTVPLDDLRFVGPHDDRHYILDPSMKSWVGVGASTDCRGDEKDLCIELKSDNPDKNYVAPCEAACLVWELSGCSSQYGLTGPSCLNMCVSINDDAAEAADMPKDGWGWSYVSCLESVLFGMHRSNEHQHDQNDCWKMTSMCRDIFSTGQLDEFGNGPSDYTSKRQGAHIPLSYPLALLAALISTVYIVYALSGRPRRANIGIRDLFVYRRLEDEEQE
jgi:beta-glucosidase